MFAVLCTLDTVYGAVKVTVEVHAVHLMNIEQCQVDANLLTELSDFGGPSTCRLLSSTTQSPVNDYDLKRYRIDGYAMERRLSRGIG